MKKIIFILFLFILGCSSLNYPESSLSLTKMYVGKYLDALYVEDQNFCFITTTMGIFRVKDCPTVPDSALCYIRREYPRYDMHPDLEWQMEKQLFTWNGTDKEYKLVKNIDFRYIRTNF